MLTILAFALATSPAATPSKPAPRPQITNVIKSRHRTAALKAGAKAAPRPPGKQDATRSRPKKRPAPPGKPVGARRPAAKVQARPMPTTIDAAHSQQGKGHKD